MHAFFPRGFYPIFFRATDVLNGADGPGGREGAVIYFNEADIGPTMCR